jgi:hypothetical protein
MAIPVAGLDTVDPDLVLERDPVARRVGWLVAVFALALVIRLAFLAAHPRPLQSDEIDYDRLAWTLAGTGTYSTDGHPTAYRPVGYPAFLAAIYSLAGRSPAAARLAQAVLDSGTAVLLFLVFSRRNRRAGIAAGVLWALFPAAILFSSQIFSECLLVFALVLFLWLGDRETPSRWLTWGAGLLLGALILVKPLAMGFFAASAPFLVHRTSGAKRLTMLALALLPAGLWILRNTLVMGAPVLSTSVGTNLFIGNNPRATGSYAPVASAVAPPHGGAEIADDAAAAHAALDWIGGHPAESLARAVKKTLFLLTSEGELVVGHFAAGEPAGRYRERFRSVPAWLHILISLPTALLMILGALGLATRRPDRIGSLFYALLFATLLSCVIFFGGSRFRFPLMALIAGFAAEFLVDRRARMLALTRKNLAIVVAFTGACVAVWAAEIAAMIPLG